MSYFQEQLQKEGRQLHPKLLEHFGKYIMAKKRVDKVKQVDDLHKKRLAHNDYKLEAEDWLGDSLTFVVEMKNDLYAKLAACCVEFSGRYKLEEPFTSSGRFPAGTKQYEVGGSVYRAMLSGIPVGSTGLLTASVTPEHYAYFVRSPYGVAYMLQIKKLQLWAAKKYESWEVICARNPSWVSLSFAIPFEDIDEGLASGQLEGVKVNLGEVTA